MDHTCMKMPYCVVPQLIALSILTGHISIFWSFLVFPWRKGGGRSGVGGEESVEMKICFTLVHVLVLGNPLQKLNL